MSLKSSLSPACLALQTGTRALSLVYLTLACTYMAHDKDPLFPL